MEEPQQIRRLSNALFTTKSNDSSAIDSVVEGGFAADTSDHAEAYLDYQAKQLGVPQLDVLVVCNLIFHSDKILLIKLGNAVRSWSNQIGVPLYRLIREGDHGLEAILNSRIDMKISDDISVDEYIRVAARTQIGMDPSRLKSSKAATALLTAVEPGELKGSSIWLRASFLWSIEEEGNVKADGSVVKDAWWASEEEVDELGSEEFFFGMKEEIKMAFDLRKRKGSMAVG